MTDFNHPRWGRQFEAFMQEFSRLCVACRIDILEPGVGERVLNNDDSVCKRQNPDAFRKLRKALMAFYVLEEKAIDKLGPEEVLIMLDQLRIEVAKLRGVKLEDLPTDKGSPDSN